MLLKAAQAAGFFLTEPGGCATIKEEINGGKAAENRMGKSDAERKKSVYFKGH